MSHKLTIKQEEAAQKFIELKDQSKAYRAVYNTENMKPETIHRAAHELFQNPKVAARVAELQEEHRKHHDITVESITEELEEARSSALQNKQSSAAVNASMGKAKIHGLVTEKYDHTVNITIDHKRGEIAKRFAERLLRKKRRK